jgi:hypothetical protein
MQMLAIVCIRYRVQRQVIKVELLVKEGNQNQTVRAFGVSTVGMCSSARRR